jgi:signal transduction histidine kinase
VGNGVSERVEVWGTDVVRLLAGIFLIIAAGTAGLRRRPPDTPARLGIFPLLGAAGSAVLALLVWQVPISRQGLLMRTAWPASASSLVGLVGAALFFVAAYRLAVRSLAGTDPFLGWISAGCIFGGFAQVCYALLPAGGSGWLRAGDLLRAAALGTWGVGAVAEIMSYWSEIAESARRETRRAVALDLHDGLAQELALLAAYTRYPEEDRAGADWQAQLQLTADRALAEARRAITVLASDRPLPLATDLGRTAADVDAEVDVRVDMGDRLDGVPLTDPMQRESVVRIVREAVTNAVRHGGARHIDILVGADDTPTLRVFDDGVGFDVAGAEQSGRLGLVSMRERAAAIGAILEVRSAPGEGTTVELLWR